MTILPLTDCCAMLGIDPKTLRHWLKHANVQFAAHPTDARIKCLTLENVQQLATLHGRPLPSPASAPPALPEEAPALGSSEERASPKQESEAAHIQATRLLPTSFPQEVDLIQKLSCLETKVTTMQEQLVQLALALLHERELRAMSSACTLLRRLSHQQRDKPRCHQPSRRWRDSANQGQQTAKSEACTRLSYAHVPV